ncbi:MAG: SusC/RagA family TonB-linked outer membrane protein [Prevotella sp.]|jgi:TonB-linked SusC/RagA family outer membrane protein
MKHRVNYFSSLLLLAFLLLLPLGASAQGNVVKGTVQSDDGPVIGATIRVKGSSSAGAVTDLDGKFSINAKKGSTLVISYVGYEDKEVKVGSEPVNVYLKEDTKLLNEVVVVGYGTMKRSDLTGSVTSVGENALKHSVTTSIDQALQGRAAGVQIQANTGTPGGSNTIRIRGTNSLNATSQPIFVIDGVIIDTSNSDDGDTNPLASINPSDIVSMDVLKDASATAIYGSRASNGVIMITTRRGHSGEATVTYDGYVGWQSMPKKLDVMNLREYAEHYNAIAEAGIKSASSSFVRPDLLGEGTDWQDALFRNALMTSHNVSLTGGSDKVTYAFSGGYLQQQGIAIGSDYKRQTLRGNIDAQLKKWLKGGINFSLADSKQDVLSNSSSIILTALRSQPSVAVRSADGTYDGPDDQWMPDNPVALAEITDNYNKKTNFRVNTYLEATIFKGLSFKTEVSADYNYNKYYYYMPDYQFGVKTSDVRTSRWTKTDTKYWSWRNILTYINTFGKHNINAMLGQEMSHNHYETQVTSANDFLSNTAKDPSAGSNDSSTPVGYQENTSLFSYFGRVFYSYNDRYLATFTLRRDGSSRFAEGNRWGWFPSAALAWRISQEDFLKDNKTISNLKLRLGWGETGNQNVENWAYAAMLNTYETPWGVGVLNANNANPDLKWETTYSTNIGFDLSLFDGRIDFVFDWYYKKTKDLLLQVDLPAFLGSGAGSSYGTASNPWANVGSLRNTGVEMTLNTVNIKNRNFQWTSNVVFSLNRNKILSLDTETGTLPQTLQIGSETTTVTNSVVGHPIGMFWGYKVIGRFDNPEDFYYKDADGNVHQVALPTGSTISEDGTWLGDYRFADLNDDGVIDNNDQTFIGNPEPKFTFGFGNTFSYKGFDLTIQFSGSYGNDVLNYNRRYLEITGATSNLLSTVIDYAVVEKIDPDGPDDFRNYYVSNPTTTMPRLYTSSSTNGNNRLSDLYIEDGSYLRLQNLSLGYTFPKSWLRNTFLNSVRIYTNIQNLFTITKYDGYDPEVGSLWGNALMNGIDYNRYPSPRIYTFGINVSF